MKRVLLDTNIYGDIVVDPEVSVIKEKYLNQRDIIIYGYSLIRKELRAIPLTRTMQGRNFRIAVLSLYDELVGEHIVDIDDKVIHDTALKYYSAYRNFGGIHPLNVMLNDYALVACATHKNMDVIATSDDATMFSDASLKSYHLVNKRLKLPVPRFITYEEFKNLLLRDLPV